MGVQSLFQPGRLADFWGVLREVDPQQVIREAEQPVHLVICGPPASGKRLLAAALCGGAYHAATVQIDVCDMPDDIPIALPTADLYLYVVRADDRLGERQRLHLRQLTQRPGRVICALNRPPELIAPNVQNLQERAVEILGLAPGRVYCTSAWDTSLVQRELIPGLVREISHLALPLGRHLGTVRDPAAEVLILDTARVNAEFSVLASLPALVPVVGSLASAGTDLIVLTKNQVMLILKLALLYQHSIDNRLQVLAEVAPVIGGAFFWRGVARTLTAALPGPLGLAPRGIVAFVGTFVAGRAGQYYYRSGLRPSADLLDDFRDEAIRHLGEFGRHFRLF